MEKEIEHQKENPKKSLEERIKEFEEGMKEEMEKGDIHLEKFNPAELSETFLIMYEGINEKSLSVEQFIRLRGQVYNYLGWAADQVHTINRLKEGKEGNSMA